MKSKEEYIKLVEELRKRGLSNGSAFGSHSGLADEAADAIEDLISGVDFQTNIITVKTPLGTLIARPSGGEPDYPGILVEMRRPFINGDLELALVEYTATEADVDGEHIITRAYRDALEDEYTDRIVHTGIEEYFKIEGWIQPT